MVRFLVFGRTAYHEPLQFQGRVEAESVEAASQIPLGGSQAWVELVLIPEDRIRWVIGPAGDGDERGA